MLVAIVLPFVMRGITMSAQNASNADRRETALMLAQTQLDEAVLAEAWQFGGAEGVFDEVYGREAERYTWELTIDDWVSTDFHELTMTVRWMRGLEEQSVRLKTVVYAGA
ncbi:MAG: hypothetical protein ACE37H_12160 [Phycisphaeraceae bacterium]